MLPRIGHLTALDDYMVYRVLGKESAHGQTGVPGRR